MALWRNQIGLLPGQVEHPSDRVEQFRLQVELFRNQVALFSSIPRRILINSLQNADYAKWFEQIIGFKADEIAAGTWPVHLTADLDALYAAMWDAWDDYDRLNNELHETTFKAYDGAAKPVLKRLQSLRELLPTLFGGDDAVLGEFGIAREIPRDKEDLFTVASGCIEHWNDITDPSVPYDYAPVMDMFADFAGEYDAFQAAWTAYIEKTRDVEEAQNLLLTNRALCHEAERLVFHWYKGLHLDGNDEWWTATPWGTVSGGSGEEPGGDGELLEIPDAPTGFTVELRMEPSPFMLISCDEYGEHTGFDILRAETPAEFNESPVMPDELFIENTGLPLMDGEIMPGMKYWYQIRARNGNDVGEWTEIVSVDYN